MKIVAVVEDNADNRLLVRAILEDLYEIVEFDNGFSALDAFGAHPPDLVLVDISLPEMDGTEVLQYLRRSEQLRALPVVALTAHAMAGDREKYLALGFDDYISKPIIDEDALIGAIEHLLANPRG